MLTMSQDQVKTRQIFIMNSNAEARRQMHYAEYLVRMGIECPVIYRPAIERAYMTTTEERVARRLHVALDQI